MTFHPYGNSLPCCTSSGPLALVVCGVCPVACDTLLCAAQRGNVFPSCFCFFCYNHGKFIKIPLQIQPSYPLFLPKNRFLWYFSIRLQEIWCPVPCPTEVWCPIHHYAYRGVMPQHRDGDGMRCPMTRPTVRQKGAARCMGIRSALRWRMQCAAWAHAPHCVFGGRTAGLWLQRAEGVSHRQCQCPRKGFPYAIISVGRDGPKP